MVTRRKVSTGAADAPVKRRKIGGAGDTTPAPASSNYFSTIENKEGLELFSSGCYIFDAVLGGGYALGRIANIVGDKSSGKTLLAIEACANFARTYADGEIRYAEAEAAFDQRYAAVLGLPVAVTTFTENVFTVEDFFEDLETFIKRLEGRPGLYIVDSLDALSDRAEMERKIDEGSYAMQKQKKLSEIFRRKVRDIEASRVCVIIISQIRDKIGVTFGETKTRSGGKALDFYASQVIWLAEIEKLKKTSEKIQRIIGVRVRARCKKNKIGLPFRECEYPIIFGYGIDDLVAGVEWLIDVGREDRLSELGLSKAGYKIRMDRLRDKGGEEVLTMRTQLKAMISTEWRNIEERFLPTASKY